MSRSFPEMPENIMRGRGDGRWEKRARCDVTVVNVNVVCIRGTRNGGTVSFTNH